jgi:hypothetical protein
MLQKIRFVFFFFDKKDPKLSLSELLSMMTIIQFKPDSIHMTFYVNPSWACALFRNNKQHVVLGQKRVSTRGRTRTLTDSERKRNRSAVTSKWNKCRIYVGDQLERWNDLKEVLRVQIHVEVSCNNVAPVTNLCLGRATTRSHSSQWSKKKFAVET